MNAQLMDARSTSATSLALDTNLSRQALRAAVATLTRGERRRFASWPPHGVPDGPAGVYAIWRGDELLFVDSADDVLGRLALHARARRHEHPFNSFVCDRFVVPRLRMEKVGALDNGARLLDRLTEAYVAQHLEYRVWVAPDAAAARRVASVVRRVGILGRRPGFVAVD